MTSVLATDGYKFSMAETGWPLREETFHYSQRRGGPQLVPFDVEAEIQKLLPSWTKADARFLAQHQYEPGPGFWAALGQRHRLKVRALPKGAVFFPREPVFSVTGPSALVSWLEPSVLQLHWRIQLATRARFDPESLPSLLARVTCAREKGIARELLDALGVPAPKMRVDSEAYRAGVERNARGLVELVGDPDRLFEVGLRSASCVEQHLIALDGCKAAGLTRTSHVLGARKHSMIPVGTMGHEHVQRYGSDEAAFRAMRDRRPQRSSYLLDTYDTLRSGMPAAFMLLSEAPERGDSVRYDSGDEATQYRTVTAEARRRGLRPVQILEDALNETVTRKLEALRTELGWGPDEQFYGYGGFLVDKPAFSGLTRERVSAVYKLSQTGPKATMKFADAPDRGKASLPGRPVVFRRVSGEGPIGIVGQEGEEPPPGYVCITGTDRPLPEPTTEALFHAPEAVAFSAATRALVDRLEADREAMIARWR